MKGEKLFNEMKPELSEDRFYGWNCELKSNEDGVRATNNEVLDLITTNNFIDKMFNHAIKKNKDIGRDFFNQLDDLAERTLTALLIIIDKEQREVCKECKTTMPCCKADCGIHKLLKARENKPAIDQDSKYEFNACESCQHYRTSCHNDNPPYVKNIKFSKHELAEMGIKIQADIKYITESNLNQLTEENKQQVTELVNEIIKHMKEFEQTFVTNSDKFKATELSRKENIVKSILKQIKGGNKREAK